jgi:hypothetical protein
VFKIFASIAIITAIAADASPAPEAMPARVLSAPNAALKSDRLDIGLHRASCAPLHQDGACLDDRAAGVGEARKVRVVPADPLPRRNERPAADMQPHHPPQDRDRCVSLPPSCGSLRSMRAVS